MLDSVVEWRWADPQPSLEPLETERLFGRRSRWLKQAPRQPSDTAGRVGLDAAGQIVSLGESTVYAYEPACVWGYTLRDDESLHTVERWTVADGRFIAKVEAEDGPSWELTHYAYDNLGRIVLIDQEFWIDGDKCMAMHGHMTNHAVYDQDGELAEIIRHRHHDRSTQVAFRAKPRSARQQRDELAELIRRGVLAALGDIPDGSDVRAVCLFYGTFDLDPPLVIVERTGRLDGEVDRLHIDDFSPLEWYVPLHDRIDLGTKVAWPTGGVLESEQGPKIMHGVLRAVAKSLDPQDIAAALGTRREPLLFAIDSERVHARAHLTDAVGAAVARKVLAHA